MWNKPRTHSNLIPFASEAFSENTISSEQLLPSLLLCAFSKQHTIADGRVSAKEWKPSCNWSFAIRHQDSGCSGDSMLVTEWKRETFFPQTMGQLHLHPRPTSCVEGLHLPSPCERKRGAQAQPQHSCLMRRSQGPCPWRSAAAEMRFKQMCMLQLGKHTGKGSPSTTP